MLYRGISRDGVKRFRVKEQYAMGRSVCVISYQDCHMQCSSS